MGWGQGVPNPFRGPPSLLFVVLCCCLGAQEACGGRESLTSLPVNNDFLLGADPSGAESPGRALSFCWRRKRWCESIPSTDPGGQSPGAGGGPPAESRAQNRLPGVPR